MSEHDNRCERQYAGNGWCFCDKRKEVMEKMADSVTAGGKPSKGTPADKRIKENKPKK